MYYMDTALATISTHSNSLFYSAPKKTSYVPIRRRRHNAQAKMSVSPLSLSLLSPLLTLRTTFCQGSVVVPCFLPFAAAPYFIAHFKSFTALTLSLTHMRGLPIFPPDPPPQTPQVDTAPGVKAGGSDMPPKVSRNKGFLNKGGFANNGINAKMQLLAARCEGKIPL